MGARRTTATAAILAALALLTVAPALAGASSSGARNFADPAGDAGTGFDVTKVSVTNNAAGKITFRVALPAVTALPDNMVVSLLLNTDGKPTGNSGIDFTIVVTKGVAVLVKTVGDSGRALIPESLSSLFTPGLMTVSINRRDLGDTVLFQFLAATFIQLPDQSLDTTNTDTAPSSGIGVYFVNLPTRLLVRSSTLSPARPAAGGTFSARMFVRDATYATPGPPVTGGTVTCSFRVGGRPVTARGAVTSGGRATCSGTIPADASGARLAGTIRYRLDGVTISRPLSATVR